MCHSHLQLAVLAASAMPVKTVWTAAKALWLAVLAHATAGPGARVVLAGPAVDAVALRLPSPMSVTLPLRTMALATRSPRPQRQAVRVATAGLETWVGSAPRGFSSRGKHGRNACNCRSAPTYCAACCQQRLQGVLRRSTRRQ